MTIRPAFAAFAAACLLAGCVSEDAPGTADASATAAAAGTPSLAEQGCLREVTATTGNGDVTVLGSEFSQAGTNVTVGVGPDRAPWSCIGYEDGTVAPDSIVSLTNEGFL
jgi:hypothetical protein